MTLSKHSNFDALPLLFRGTPDLNSARSHDSKTVLSVFIAQILEEKRFAGQGDHTDRLPWQQGQGKSVTVASNEDIVSGTGTHRSSSAVSFVPERGQIGQE